MGDQRFSHRVRRISSSCRALGASFWIAPGPYRCCPLVGSLLCAHCAGASRYRRLAGDVDDCAVRVGSRRGGHVSCGQSIRGTLVSNRRAGQSEWHHLWRSRVGSGVTPPIVTAIILYYGWRASFWFSAVVGIFAGACWYWMARNTPEEHPRISSVELSWIQQRRAMEGSADTLSHGPNRRPVPWTRIFTSTEMIALTLSYFSFGYVAWVFFGWFYIYLAQARGLNLRSSALYSMLPFVGMTIGCLMGGVLSDWVARRLSIRLGRCLIPAASMAVTAALLILGSRAHEARTAGVVLACGAGALYVSQSCFFAITADFAGEFAGVASGIMNMGGQVGGACTSSLTPLIAAHFGWEQSFVVAASFSVLGAIAWLTVDPKNSLSISELAC